MKALILAAGLGERMRPLTDTTPKPLLRVGGKPLIAWHLEKLAAIGVRDVVVNTSWLAEQFPQALGDGSQWGLHIAYSYEGTAPLETGGGMLHALPLLRDAPASDAAFIAVNADVWTDYDFARLPREPAGLAHVVAIPLPEFRQPGPFEQALATLLPPEAGLHTLAGIGVYRPSLLDGATPGRFSIVPGLIEAIDAGQVTAEILSGTWRDIGTPERLVELDRMLEQV